MQPQRLSEPSCYRVRGSCSESQSSFPGSDEFGLCIQLTAQPARSEPSAAAAAGDADPRGPLLFLRRGNESSIFSFLFTMLCHLIFFNIYFHPNFQTQDISCEKRRSAIREHARKERRISSAWISGVHKKLISMFSFQKKEIDVCPPFRILFTQHRSDENRGKSIDGRRIFIVS